MKLSHTRAILDAINSGALADAPTRRDPVFGFDAVTACPGVPASILVPRDTWADPHAYDATARKLARLFRENFRAYESAAGPEVRSAGPTEG
jgi:phosphoenolpyruvate carboxykinase (ATP)